MLKAIQDHLEARIDEMEVETLVDGDMIYDFMWEHDFGAEIINNYIEENSNEIAQGILEEIYEEIDSSDLECPW